MKEIKKILIAIFLVAVLLAAVDFAVGAVGDAAMQCLPNYSGQLAKDNYRLHRVEKDIVIIGSSRGSHHYVTTLLNDSINRYTGKRYSLYNAAIDGKFINSNSCAAESILNRYTPQLLIFEVGESELYHTGGSKADMLFSAPHYRYNSIVHSYLDSLGRKEQAMMKSSLFRYNGKLFRIASSFMVEGDSTGYAPLFNVMKPSPEKSKNADTKEKERIYDPYSLQNFTRVLKICQERNVHLVVATSPHYRPNGNNEYLRRLCVQHHIPYIERYDTDLFNNNPHYFQDASHLNDSGAHVYTKLFFQDLKPFLEHLR